MRQCTILAILAVLLFSTILMGCSGGGASISGSSGQVRGTVAAAALLSGTSGVSVALDGQNISVPVATDGSFVLNNVPAGVYTLVAKSANQAATMLVTVSGGKVTNVGQLTLSGAGQIAGLVTDAATGAPLAGVQVTVTENVSPTANQTLLPVRTSITNSAGSYLIDALPAGDYLATLSDNGYQSTTLDLTVSAGATTVGDDALTAVSSTATGSLQGVVYGVNADQTVTPLSGVYIVVSASTFPPSPQPLAMQRVISNTKHRVIVNPLPPIWPTYYAYSASDGSYHIDGIPAGTYNAVAMRQGFSESSQSVTIVANKTTTVSFKLTLFQIQVGSVSGTVTDANTQLPIVGATVSAAVFTPMARGSGTAYASSAIAIPSIGLISSMTAITDQQGHYTLQLPIADSDIICWAYGFQSSEQSITLSQNQSITVNFALIPFPTNPHTQVTLSGIVEESAGGVSTATIPVAGATVYLITNSTLGSTAMPNKLYSTTSDAHGAYTITLPSDLYNINAQKGDMMSANSQLSIYQDMTQNFLLLSTSVVEPM